MPVLAQHAGANLEDQAGVTLKFNPVDNWPLLTSEGNVPALVQLEEEVRNAYSLTGPLQDLHWLGQSNAAALFTWHTDNHLPEVEIDTSVAVSLGEAASSMAVAGANGRFEYGDELGVAAAFCSQAVHASVAAAQGTQKVVFFFGAQA
jgi:hypothetical protein